MSCCHSHGIFIKGYIILHVELGGRALHPQKCRQGSTATYSRCEGIQNLERRGTTMEIDHQLSPINANKRDESPALPGATVLFYDLLFIIAVYFIRSSCY